MAGKKELKGRERSKANLIPFKPGDPRINRKGPPKKVVRLQNLLNEIFGIEFENPEDIKKSDVGLILKAMAKAAKRGNIHAGNSVLDRLYGKPKQVVEIPGMEDARERVAALMPFAKPKKDGE